MFFALVCVLLKRILRWKSARVMRRRAGKNGSFFWPENSFFLFMIPNNPTGAFKLEDV